MDHVTFGGISSLPRKIGSSKPRMIGGPAASAPFRATTRNSFPCRTAGIDADAPPDSPGHAPDPVRNLLRAAGRQYRSLAAGKHHAGARRVDPKRSHHCRVGRGADRFRAQALKEIIRAEEAAHVALPLMLEGMEQFFCARI